MTARDHHIDLCELAQYAPDSSWSTHPGDNGGQVDWLWPRFANSGAIVPSGEAVAAIDAFSERNR